MSLMGPGEQYDEIIIFEIASIVVVSVSSFVAEYAVLSHLITSLSLFSHVDI